MLIAKTSKNLEILLNRVLAMDEEACVALAALEGRTLAVDLTDTPCYLVFTITDAGIELNEETPARADVTVTGTPGAFIGFARGGNGGIAGRVDIVGDVGVAQEIQTILRNLDLDWEESLSDWIGDSLARKAGNLARDTARFLSQSGRTLEMDASEYLRYEKEILPDRSEIEEFSAAVDTLRNDVERLKIRINRLQQALSRNP